MSPGRRQRFTVGENAVGENAIVGTDDWVSDHMWKFDAEADVWTCSRCGHSFPWKDTKKRVPQKFAPDGSPARDDPCWFGFQIVGLMSFIDAGKDLPEPMRRKFVGLVGLDSNSQGTHAAAFHSCMLDQEMDNLSAVISIMEE